MDKRPIGIFDSGLGGLTCVPALKQALPNEKFIYYGDSANAPYGVKSREEILGLSSNLLYIFEGLTPDHHGNFKFIQRDWQEDFEAADDSIFRKV